MGSLLFPAINFGALVALLYWKTKAPLQQYVRERHATIKDDLTTAAGQLAEAKKSYSEYSAKLKSIDTEISSLRDQAKQDAEAMKLRTLTEAKRLAGQIVADAKTSSEQLVSDLRKQIVSEVALKVLDRAEVVLRSRLTGDDQVRIRREFSSQMEHIQ